VQVDGLAPTSAHNYRATLSTALGYCVMKKLFAISGLALSLAMSAQAGYNPPASPPVAADPLTAVVEVLARNWAQPNIVSQGTGWFFNERTLITDYHVIEGYNQFMVVYPDGKRVTATLRNLNVACDLADLDVVKPRSDQWWSSIIPDSETVYPNEEVCARGCPQNHWTITYGNLTGRLTDTTGRRAVGWYSTNLFLDHGGSGSPICDDNGEVIGIAKSISKPGAPYCCLIISANVIWEALGLKNSSHPDGFRTGITNGVNLHYSH
jgi:S1-C subfamily serine protease